MSDYAAIRSRDDLLLDGIKNKIAATEAADALVYPALAYDVERDKISPWQDLARPLVTVELSTDTPKGRDYTAHISVACAVPSLGDDETAGLRFALLKEQVRRALTRLSDPDFGQSLGSLGVISLPSWGRNAFDDDALDSTILIGTWSLDITYDYRPVDITGPALSEVSISLGRFAALYHLGGSE
jgi:hypothetical protein